MVSTFSFTTTKALPLHLPFKVYPIQSIAAKVHSKSLHKTLQFFFITSACRSSPRTSDVNESSITLQEWQGWGTASPLPAKVKEVVDELKSLEQISDAQMTFGGNHGKLQGEFRAVEDRKHRAKYLALDDPEEKFQFYSARQIACRLLGSRYYFCQKCWLPMEDCMCSKVAPCALWPRMRFWVYMHPKDFLRQNNTGKLLWQIFGVQAATMCLYGVAEHEEIMWNAFQLAGENRVWCLYPNQNEVQRSVPEAFSQETSSSSEYTVENNGGEVLNFILIDGTWNNSAAMFRRLKEQANYVWGNDLRCLSLSMGASAMHELRPQPSWDRTCTAAAASGLLSELHLLPEFSSYGLDKQAAALEDALVILLEALTNRRIRMGRSITRKVRHTSNIPLKVSSNS